MADRIADYDSFRGLLIQDPRITGVDSTESVLSEAGPRPGVPVPQQATEMVLQATGAQSAGGQLRVQTTRAGMPLGDGATFVWQNEGDSLWRGWDQPSNPTHWEAVRWLNGTAPTETGASKCHAVTLLDRSIIVAIEVSATSPTTRDQVQVQVRDPDTGAWGSEVTVYTQPGGYSAGRGSHPCMLQLPGGRILLWFWAELSDGSCQVRMYYSDDTGASWALGSLTCLIDGPVTYTAEGSGAANYDLIGRLRAGYLDGEIVLMMHLREADNNLGTDKPRDFLRQYASSDLGASFNLVSTSEGIYGYPSGAFPDVAVYDGRLLIAWCSEWTGVVYVVAITSAWESWQLPDRVSPNWSEPSVTTPAVGAGRGRMISDGDLALVVGDGNGIYIVHRAVDESHLGITGGDGQGLIARSTDGGETFTYLGQSSTIGTYPSDIGTWWSCGDTATHPRDFCGVWHEGRIVLLHHWDANPGNEDNSLGALYLGGYSTVTLPGFSSAVYAERVNWDTTWLPFDEPQNVAGWSLSGAGTTALSGGALNISTSTQSALHTVAPTGTNTEGLICAGSVLENSGGSVLSGTIIVNVRVADGADDYEVQLRIGGASATGNIKLTDLNGSDIGTVVLDTSAGVDFLIAISDANVAWWVRPRSNGSDREWTAGTASTTLTSNGSPAAAHQIQWGHAGASTADSDWFSFHYTEASYTGLHLSTGQTNPDDVNARNYSTRPTYVDGGVFVQAVDGPTMSTDEWNINTRADYAVDRLLPTVAPSPRNTWRSIGTGETKIAFALDPTITAASRSGNTVIGVAVMGANFRTFSIEGDTGGGSWSQLATFDAAEGMASMAFTRAGNSLEADSGSTDKPYLFHSEASNWTADLGGGNLRRVQWSSEGKWDNSGKRARIFCDGITNSEASTGTMSLWPSDFTAVLRVNNVNYAGYRLVIDSQSTVAGYHTIGSIVVGPIVVMGQAYSWGRVVETSANVVRMQNADWTDRVRKLSPARRVVQFGWQDGTDLSSVEADGTPDFLTTSTNGGTEPAASWADTPYVLEGLVHLLDGGRLPLVYLPKMPKGASGAGNDSHILNRRHSMVYARSMSPVRIETVIGTENTDEVVRVGQMVLTEIV